MKKFFHHKPNAIVLVIVLVLVYLLTIFITSKILRCDFRGATKFLRNPSNYPKIEEEIVTPYGDTFIRVQQRRPSPTSRYGYDRVQVDFYYKGDRFFQAYDGKNARIEPVSNDDKGTVYAIVCGVDKEYYIRKSDSDTFELLKREYEDVYSGRWFPYGTSPKNALGSDNPSSLAIFLPLF
jgi:hypothetical protein